MPEVTFVHNKLNTVGKIKGEFKRKEYVILYNLSICYYLACRADNCHVYHILWWAKFVNDVSLKMSDLKDSVILK